METKIPIFRKFVIQNFPYIEEDFDALTDYQLYSKVVEYLNKCITATNQTSEQMATLQYYVDHYFDNLDVQTEINNKLEEMAESGQLEDLIAEYLNLRGVFGYDTVSDMAGGDNLVNGSIAKTLGRYSYNDGMGAFYKVREILNTDVVDGYNIVAITDSVNLVAERIPETVNRKYLFIGDSYGDGYTPDGTVTSWITNAVNNLGLSSGDYISKHLGGTGFARPSGYNFLDLIDEVPANNSITDIIIGGGYNDYPYTTEQITLGINNVYDACRTKFPNAKIYVAFMGWTTNATNKTTLINTYNAYYLAINGLDEMSMIPNVQYILHDYFNVFASDGIHPNSTGQVRLGRAISDFLSGKSVNVFYTKGISFTPVGGSLTGTWNGKSVLDNNVTSIGWDGTGNITFASETPLTITGKSLTQIGTITGGLMIGNSIENCNCGVMCVIQATDNNYYELPCNLIIKDSKLYIRSNLINSSHNNYLSYTVKNIQIGAVNITVPTFNA